MYDPGIPNDPAQPGWYEQFLHRPADVAGATYFADQMDAATPQEDILVSLVSSDEFYGSSVPYYGAGYSV